MSTRSYILRGIGFLFQYIAPIALFGFVVPYYHGTLQSGLTSFGYLALIVAALVIGSKLKKTTKTFPKGFIRGILLAGFPLIGWAIVSLVADYLLAFITLFVRYWDKTLIFILIGRIFYLIDESSGEDDG